MPSSATHRKSYSLGMCLHGGQHLHVRKLSTISSIAPHAAPDVGTLTHEAILIGCNLHDCPYLLKASELGSSSQQHSMLITLLTGPMHTYLVFSSCAAPHHCCEEPFLLHAKSCSKSTKQPNLSMRGKIGMLFRGCQSARADLIVHMPHDFSESLLAETRPQQQALCLVQRPPQDVLDLGGAGSTGLWARTGSWLRSSPLHHSWYHTALCAG